MRLAALLAATLAALGGAGAAHASSVAGPQSGREVVFVANAEGGTVAIVDAHRMKVLREIDVIPDGPDAEVGEDDPAQAAARQRVVEAAGGTNYAQDQDISPDGRTLYVSRGHRGDIAAFDIASGRMRWKLPIPGFRSDHMTMSDDGSRLYVSALTENVVVVVDTAGPREVARIPGGQWPHDNHLSPDGERLYNASIGTIVAPEESRSLASPPPYVLTVASAGDHSVLRSFRFDRGIRPIVITRDESRLYAQLSGLHGLIEFDLRGGRVTRTLDLPVDEGVSEDDWDFEAPHHGLAISDDEEVLCAAGRASDYVALVAAKTFERLRIIEVGDAPGWAATGPAGRHCFVPNTREDTLSVISYRHRREVARLQVGDGPKQIEAARIPETVLCAQRGVPGCTRDLALSRRCARGKRLDLRIRGDTDAVRRVSFRLGRARVGRRDAKPPFRRVVPRRRLAHTRARTVRATIEYFDGQTVLRRARRLSRCGL